ncbi:MAG: hypothetical protein ACI9ON_002440 [Limisphaerales bacterium]|jgi:hypothetical protein
MRVLSLDKPAGFFGGRRRNSPSEIIESPLLGKVLRGFEGDECLHILDVGIGAVDTLKFLQQYRCKVYFLDLAESFADSTEPRIRTTLSEYSGELFDICLFWDLLHCLSAAQLAVLSDALEPYIYSETRVHTLANLVDPGEHYCVRGANQLSPIRGRGRGKARGQPTDYATRSITELDEHFSCFQLTTDEYHADGRLEMVLETRGRNKP